MKTVRQLVSFRNIVPLISIILAFLGATGFLENLGYASDKIILVILGVLAVDTVVERLGYLIRIEDKVNSLSSVISKPKFLSRALLNDEEPFEQFVGGGQDVLISGVALGATAGPHRAFFRKTVQQGTNLRFLLLDPNSQCVEFAARSHGTSPESLRNDLLSTLGYIKELKEALGDSRNGSIQVRLLRTVPEAGIAMRDGNRDTGVIRCEPYLYQTDVSERPAFRLTLSDDGVAYHRYRDAIERMWNDSLPYQPA
jgi:hypothetical protein